LEEAEAVYGSEKISYSDHKKLIQASRVFKEALRLFSPVQAFPKYTEKDVTVGKWKIPGEVCEIL
jgi:cytochrome P450